MGVLGLSRREFYTSTIGELNTRIEGYLMRALQIENIGDRRVALTIRNGMAALGKGKQISEEKFWPMEMDNWKPKKILPKSEEMVQKNWEFLKKIWPDLDGKNS